MSLPRFAVFEGRVVHYEQAKIGILAHTLNYGTGVFGGIRGYWNEKQQQLFLFRVRDHFRRFLDSTSLLYMEIPNSVDELIQLLTELLSAEALRCDCYIRPFAYFGDETIGSHLAALTPKISMVAFPFTPEKKRDTGLHITVSGWRRIDDNMIPARGKIAGAYVNSYLAKTQAILAGFDDAVLLNVDGHLAEGSITNIFIIRNGIACTPPRTDNILEGITRQSLITLLREDLGMVVEERSIDRTEIYLAEEAFFCGTATQVAAVTRVDHRRIGTGQIGPITASLSELYLQVVQGQTEKYLDWCSAVYPPIKIMQNTMRTRNLA